MATKARNGLEHSAKKADTPTRQLRKESSADSAFSKLTSPVEPLSPKVLFPDESIERSSSLTASESSVHDDHDDPPGMEQSSSPPPRIPDAQERPNNCLAVPSNGRSSITTASQRGRDFEGPWLDKEIDCENRGVLKHLGRIADMMYEWEGRIAEELGLTPANIAAIRMKQPSELRLQTREALLTWKQRLGKDATYRNLAHVFEEAGYQDFANFVKIKAASGENGIISRSDSINAGEMDNFTIQTIRSNEAKIKDSFSELLDCLEEALTAQAELSVNKVHRYLVVTCPITVPKASLSEMFDFVTSNNGWSYQNYGPLDNFVKRFLPHKRKQMLEYKNDVSGFCVTVKLIDYIQFRNFTAKELPAPADSEQHSRAELCVKLKDKLNVERKVSTRSLQYVIDLWEDVAEDFDIPCLTAIIHKIVDGSLIIVWLVLSDTGENIASRASTEKSICFFLQHDIVFVSINDKVLFDTIHFLLDIVTRGDWQRLKDLLRQYGSVFELNVSYQEGKSLLTIAAEMGQEMAMLSLLDNGAEYTFKQESSGRTALHFAAENGHVIATAILLAYGTDPHQKDSANETAYDVAKRKGNESVCKEFQPYFSQKVQQSDVRSISTRQRISNKFEGWRVAVLSLFTTKDIIGATKNQDVETLEQLIEREEADIQELIQAREKDKHGWTALMWASEKGNSKIVKLLLKRGADPNVAAKSNGWTALMLASRRGYLNVVKILLDYNADPNLLNKEDASALSIALYEKKTAVALLLIHRGANISSADQDKITSSGEQALSHWKDSDSTKLKLGPKSSDGIAVGDHEEPPEPPPSAEPVSPPLVQPTLPSIQQSWSSAGPPPRKPSAQQPTASIPPGTLSMTMLSFQRQVEMDVLQAHTADLSQVLSIDPDQFGSLLVQCGFAAHPTISGIVSTPGISNYRKATQLLTIVDARIMTASSSEAARNLFDTVVQIVAYPMGHLHLAEALVTTCKSKDPSYVSPLLAATQPSVSRSISTTPTNPGSMAGPSLSSDSVNSLQSTAQSATNASSVSRPIQPGVDLGSDITQPKASLPRTTVTGLYQALPSSTSDATSRSTTSPLLQGPVRYRDLALIRWRDDQGRRQRLYLTENIAHKWLTIGELIGLPFSKLETIAEEYHDKPERCCRSVLARWLENPPPDYPATWAGLIELLEDSHLGEVASQLRTALSKAEF